MGDFIGTTISGMTGRGSIRHNNRSFSAANIDRSRTEQNVTYCNDDLKQVYHEIFDEALAAYNAGMGNVSGWLESGDYSHDGETLHTIPYPETDAYVKKVQRAYGLYQKLYEE